jgi:SAM-dependent methyltransferase
LSGLSGLSAAQRERAWLHRGGRAAAWGNLGLWPAADYAAACEALADAVARAAGITPKMRVLSIGCGAGEELSRWRSVWVAGAVVGIERDAALAAEARARPGVEGVFDSLDSMPADSAPFDAVLCVDAAYHFDPRADWLRALRQRLRPGGVLAFSDLVLAEGTRPSAGLTLAAGLCGLLVREIVSVAAAEARLLAAGFEPLANTPVDQAVLDGFAHFVRSREGGPGSLRPRVTAALVGPARRRGLGCTVFAARHDRRP